MRDAVPRYGIEHQVIEEAAAHADTEAQDVQTVERTRDRHAARTRQLRGKWIADQSVGALCLDGAAGGGHQRRIADMGDLVGFRRHGFHYRHKLRSEDAANPQQRLACVACAVAVCLYWPGLTTWFYQDDFGWLNLRHDVHSARDLAGALLAPKAHGNMRPLGENAYWLSLGAIFGVEPLAFHICTFLTQSASLLLLGSIVQRLVAWAPAGLCAQILWLINCGLAPAMGWSSIYNQVLSAFFFLLAFYFLLRHIETGRRAYEVAHWAAFVLGLGALEINVVYPALAALYVLFRAPRLPEENSADVRSVGGGGSGALLLRAAAARRSLRAANRCRARHDALDLLALGAGSDAADWRPLVAACVLALIVWGLDGASHRIIRRRVVCDYLAAVPASSRSQDGLLPGGALDRHRDGRRVCDCETREVRRQLARLAIVLAILVYSGSSLQASWTGHPLAARTRGAGGRSGARRGRSSSGGKGKDHSAGRDR